MPVSPLVKPIWEGNVVEDESVLPIRDQNGAVAPMRLVYPADEIISVRSATHEALYTPGADYVLNNGDLVIPAGSRIPVTGNGSVVDAASAAAMAATGVSAVMVGRAALKEPGLFGRLRAGLPAPASGVERARGLFRRHVELLRKYCAWMAERFPGERLPDADGWMLVKVRTHLFRYFGGCPGAASLRAGLGSARTLAAAERLVERLNDEV